MKKTLLRSMTALALIASTQAEAAEINFDELASPPVTCCYADTGVQGPLIYSTATIKDGNNTGFVMNGTGWAGQQTSGQNLFGTTSGSMQFLFTNPVSALSFDLINGNFDSPTFLIQLFNAGGDLLESQSVSLGNYTSVTGVRTIGTVASGISRATVSGSSNFAVDTIKFSVGAVPEPSTWAMMLIGFGAIGASMRRRRRTNVVAQMA